MTHKTLSAIQTKVLNPALGQVEAFFAITGNVDRQNDRILPGAFAKALAAKSSVPVVYSHSWTDIGQVLGWSTSWREMMPGNPELPDQLQTKGFGGVKAIIQFELGVPAGQMALTHVKNKNITDWSWAFDIDDDGEKYEDGGDVRVIKSVKEIYEITLALVGANQLTQTVSAKSRADAEWAYIFSKIGAALIRTAARPAVRLGLVSSAVVDILGIGD